MSRRGGSRIWLGGGVLGDVVGEGLDGDVLLGGEPVADFEKLDAALIEHLLQGIELLD